MPGSDRDQEPARPPATFFSINAVLAKHDGQRGRGPDAVRLASLPSNVATDAPSPAMKDVKPVGKEPFGLFTFRAPEGMLWRKWRNIEADMAREQLTLNRCRTDAETCPSHAAQFLRLIGAVNSKSGRAKLEEANRAVNMAIRYVSDHTQHGEADRWSAPLASFATARATAKTTPSPNTRSCGRPAWLAKTCSWCWSVTAPSGRIMRCWLPASTIAG